MFLKHPTAHSSLYRIGYYINNLFSLYFIEFHKAKHAEETALLFGNKIWKPDSNLIIKPTKQRLFAVLVFSIQKTWAHRKFPE